MLFTFQALWSAVASAVNASGRSQSCTNDRTIQPLETLPFQHCSKSARPEKRTIVFVLAWFSVIGCLCARTIAAAPLSIRLWPDGPPGVNSPDPADNPVLTLYLPEENLASGTAIVICPGGGYARLAMNYEGHEICQWLNSIGIAGIIVDYRHRGKGYTHPAPLHDAQRALRTIRARADEWKIGPNRIGVMGFSAGGHLASSAGTHFDPGDPAADDRVEQVSCRPDFMVLGYPLISLTTEYVDEGTMHNLLGPSPTDEMKTLLSNEQQVTATTPPAFLFHTGDDRPTAPENSVLFYLALRRAGIPAEIHIFEKGRHGLGLGQGLPGVSKWPQLCETWMRRRGFLEPQ